MSDETLPGQGNPWGQPPPAGYPQQPGYPTPPGYPNNPATRHNRWGIRAGRHITRLRRATPNMRWGIRAGRHITPNNRWGIRARRPNLATQGPAARRTPDSFLVWRRACSTASSALSQSVYRWRSWPLPCQRRQRSAPTTLATQQPVPCRRPRGFLPSLRSDSSPYWPRSGFS